MKILFKLLTASFMLAILSTTPTAFGGPGLDAFNKKDYDEAYRQWAKNPKASESRYGIGRLLIEGLGGDKNPEKGLGLMLEAADARYEKAVSYLATYYERSRNYSQAIRFYERQQDKSYSQEREGKIIEFTRKSSNKSTLINKSFCSKLKDYVQKEGNALEGEMELCALQGFPSIFTKIEAERWEILRFKEKPVMSDLSGNLRKLLDPQRATFDPASAEELIWKLAPNLDNTQVINALKESKSLSPEQCIALSSSSAENVASSYCALVVFTGALDPIPIASAYFRGTFGKSRNSARAWAILEKFPYAANSGPGLLLQAELLTGENDWPRLLDLVHNKSPELKKTFDKSVIEPALLFLVQAGFENDIPRQQGSEGTNPSGLAGKTFLYGSQPSNANALGLATPPQARRFSKTDAIRLGEVVGDLVELPNSLRRETIAMLQKNKGKKSLYSDEQDNEKITTLIQNLEKLIQVSPDLDPKNSPRDLGAQPEVALSKANQVKQKAPLLMPFGESFSKCEGGEYSLCSFAAVELISAAPPPTFAEMPLEKRKEAAILLLQKAASSGEVEAMSILFDLYEESLDSSRRPLADGILERLLSDRLPQGELRRAVRLIDRDPISGLFDVITSRKEIRESCALLEKLSTDPQLSDRDKVTAISFKGSVKCAVTKPLF